MVMLLMACSSGSSRVRRCKSDSGAVRRINRLTTSVSMRCIASAQRWHSPPAVGLAGPDDVIQRVGKLRDVVERAQKPQHAARTPAGNRYEHRHRLAMALDDDAAPAVLHFADHLGQVRLEMSHTE